MINNYNNGGKYSNRENDYGSGGGGGGGGGVYGVVKHMTDEPYSFEEFSYGRIPATTEAATPFPQEEPDNWNVFPGNDNNWESHRFYQSGICVCTGL